MKGRVLVVDPEPMVREFVRRRLGEAGYETVLAGNAAEARVLGAQGEIDVVLLSVNLPDGDGFEVLSELRTMSALEGVSIAMLAGQRDTESLGRGLERGADDYLRKPMDRVELVARVAALTRLRRQIAELHRKNERLEELNAELERVASHDALTGLANRRYLETRLAEEVERVRRYRQPLAVLMLDVDHFKQVNDTHGHAAGDTVLRALGRVIGNSVRKVDLAARYGGEEIVVLAPSTGLAGALVMAERIRTAVATTRVEVTGLDGAPWVLQVTISLGVAAAQPEALGPVAELRCEDLLRAADDAMYRAKQAGRNRVEAARVEPAAPPARPG